MYDFAILGGAFNPIHNGHLYIAEEVIRHKLAKQVIFMPNGNHPLKSTSLLLPYSQRFELINLAIQDKAYFSVSKLDSPRFGINYTYHLIQRIYSTFPNSTFTFLIGYDNAVSFTKWYKQEWLLNNVNFTVVSRNSQQKDSHTIDARFKLLEIRPYDISSTEIRKHLENDQDISHLVPQPIITKLENYWKKLRLSNHQ